MNINAFQEVYRKQEAFLFPVNRKWHSTGTVYMSLCICICMNKC